MCRAWKINRRFVMRVNLPVTSLERHLLDGDSIVSRMDGKPSFRPLAVTADELRNQAEQLQQLVTFFKVAVTAAAT
jgi:hypothetical protein